MQQTLGPGDVALLVDDWAEKGAQASAVRQLVEMTGASFAGVSVAVDQLDDSTRQALGLVTALVRFEDLESPDSD
jgi:adenine/guanine phosphoribosyltransferase-like PRPP-binding protein